MHNAVCLCDFIHISYQAQRNCIRSMLPKPSSSLLGICIFSYLLCSTINLLKGANSILALFAHMPAASHHTSMCLQSNLILLYCCFQPGSQSVVRKRSQQNECHHASLQFILFYLYCSRRLSHKKETRDHKSKAGGPKSETVIGHRE